MMKKLLFGICGLNINTRQIRRKVCRQIISRTFVLLVCCQIVFFKSGFAADATATPVPPTNTPTYTFTLTPTNTYTPTITPTPTNTATFTPTVEQTPPSVSLTLPPDYWQKKDFNVSWSASDAESGLKDVRLSRNGTVIMQKTPTGALNQNLPEGDYGYFLQAEDNAGNTNDDADVVGVDLNAPSLTISSPSNNAVVNSQIIAYQGMASDTSSGISYLNIYRNNGFITSIIFYEGGGDFSYNLSLDIGSNTLKSIAYDYAGYSTTSPTLTVTYDPPPIITLNTYSNTVYTNKVNITGSINDAGYSDIKEVVFDDEQNDNNDRTYQPDSFTYNINYSWNLMRGNNNLNISARDDHSIDNKSVQVLYKKRWTCLFYAAGDNSKSAEVWNNVLELQSAVTDDSNMDIFVLYDGTGSNDSKVYHVEKGNVIEVPWVTEVNMAAPDRLANFVNYFITRYPSDHYWMGIIGDADGSSNGRLVLTDSGQQMDLAGLKTALDGISQKIDIISLDTSLLGNMETIAAIGNNADYLVATQEVMPATGFDYHALLNSLKSNLTNPGGFAGQFINVFSGQYGNVPNASVTVINLNSSLFNSFKNFANEINQYNVYSVKYPQINNAKVSVHRSNQSIGSLLDRDYADLYDLSSYLTGHVNYVNDMIASFGNAVIGFWKSSVNGNLSKAHGISIYMPDEPGEFDHNYGSTPLAGQTFWDDFIQKDITPPEIISPQLDRNAINKLEDVIGLTFSCNEACTGRLSLADSLGTEYGLINDNIFVDINTVKTVDFCGAIIQQQMKKLVNNGTYYLKLELTDSSGNKLTIPPGDGRRFYLSDMITVTIPRKQISAQVTTPPQIGTDTMLTISGFTQTISIQTSSVPFLVDAIVSTNAMPLTGIYKMKIEKNGYKTIETYNLNSNEDVFDCHEFMPYIPGESGYNAQVDSDGDGLPDGWEYKYWKDWPQWTAEAGCNLNVNDAQCDLDILYNSPSRRTEKGDGLTNKEEYELQSYFPELNPAFADLCVEIDWVSTSSYNYEPSTETKDKAKGLLMKAGIKAHWVPSPQSNQINLNETIALAPNISYNNLTSYLSSNQGTYTYNNNDQDLDIIHVIFAPGWTKVVNLPTGENPKTSFGGIYIQTPPGLYVFDRHTINMGAGRVYTQTRGIKNLDVYEAYILGHEIGHMLELDDKE